VTPVEGDSHETVRRFDGQIDPVLLDAEKEGFTGICYLAVSS
jgi:hypothetical protein